MDNLDFLDGSEEPNGEAVTTEAPAVEAPVAEAPAVEETPAEAAARERDDKGRFKAKEATEPVMVPLQALHETRDEVKALKAELEKLRPPQQQPQGQQVPDIFENPEGFTGHIQNQIAAATLNTSLNISEEMTRASAGNEVVEAAQQWGAQVFPANPALYQQFVSQRNPYGFLVEQYRKATAIQQLGDDPKNIEAFLAWRQAQQAPSQQPAPQAQAAPPQSIASAPSAGGMQTIATGPGVAFADTIK